MKVDITEKEFRENVRTPSPATSYEDFAVSVLEHIGITFKPEIDREAETHDPSVIPNNWLIEKWDIGDVHRVLGFFDFKSNSDWDFYRAIKKEYWPRWAVEQHKSLGD